MYEFFGCDYCVLLTINMLCRVQVTFNQLLNLLKRYYVYLHMFAEYLVIKSYKLLISCCIYKVTYIRLLNLLKIYDVKLDNYEDYTEMHGQQNIKFREVE